MTAPTNLKPRRREVEPKPGLTLQHRPEARSFKIEDLMNEVRRGRVRIPGFQRPLRWDASDARQLVDSLFRGYPVGTLLLWETNAEADDMKIGELRITAEARSDALWVVDGQQRIISLARILLPSAPDSDAFALYFDLDEERFTAPPTVKAREADAGRWLPMTAALNSEHLMQWVFKYAANDEQRRQAAFRIGRRIREYEVPAYLVKTESEDVLREIFGRANTTGKRLKESEVFDALHGGRGSRRPTGMADIAADLTELGFGRIEEKILFGLHKTLLGVDVSKRIPGDSLSEESASTAYANTAQAARSVVQFLKSEVGIPRYEFLPYKQPLLALGKFFHHFPEPRPRNLDLLARWVWRGALKHFFEQRARWNESDRPPLTAMLIPDEEDA